MPRYRTSASNWKQPLLWNNRQQALQRAAANAGEAPPEPWRVFCASLGDVFDNEVPQQWRADLWELIDATPALTWLLCTKRVGNVPSMVPFAWMHSPRGFPPNVRLLITVVNQAEADRDLPKLLALPCKNGVSYEPALGPVDWTRWLCRQCDAGSVPAPGGGRMCPRCKGTRLGGDGCPGIEWLIVGGESTQGGAQGRPFELSWAYDTVRQCAQGSVPCFVKQLGANPQEIACPVKVSDTEANNWMRDGWTRITEGNSQHWRKYWRLNDRAGADPEEWPVDLRVREFPR